MDEDELEKQLASFYNVTSAHVDECGMTTFISNYPHLVQNHCCKLAFEGNVQLVYVMCLLRASAQLIQLVLTAYPDGIRQLDRNGFCPLHIACQQGAPLETITILVDAFPEALIIRNVYDTIPLVLACRQRNYKNVIEYLVNKNETTVSDRTKRGETPLHSACSTPHMDSETVTFLIRQDPSALETADARGRLPLHLLLIGKPPVPLQILEYIIDAYPEALSRVSDFGMTPLHLACQQRFSLDIIRLLYDRYPEALSAPYASTPLHIAMMKRCSPNIIDFLATNYKLEEFSCIGPHFFPSPAVESAFRQGLQKNKHIRALTLIDSKIGDVSMASLLDIMKNNESIKSLTLIGATTATGGTFVVGESLTKLVSTNTTLTYLSLRNNTMPIEWMLSLASHSTFLENLDITDCNFGPLLIPILKSILHKNKTIHTMMIGGNNIGKKATMDVFTMLRYNHSIRTVAFWRDPVDDDILGSAIQALEENNATLTKVGLPGCHRYQSRQCSPHLKSLLEYYRSLNQAGRSVTRNPQTTKQEFVQMLSCSTHSETLLNGLLRDLPHLWSQ